MRNALICFCLAWTAVAVAAPGDDPLYREFRNPPDTARPFVRWWWNGLSITEKEILRELDVMKAAGIGGVEINSIAMLDEVPRESPGRIEPLEWLSPGWTRMVRAAADGARKRGMTADLIVGSGWPFGGRFLAPGDRIQRLLLVRRELEGPGRFRSSLSELARARGSGGEFEQPAPEAEPPRAAFLRLAPADSPVFDPGRDIMADAGAGGAVDLQIPAGRFVLYAGFVETGFSTVKLGAPGSDGPVVDHFNAHAVRAYLDRMSAALAPALGGTLGGRLRAMFVDSLELDRANWTGDFAAEFEKRRGYAVEPYLPFVLDADSAITAPAAADVIRRARYDFNLTLVELFRERFIRTYIDWCHANGIQGRMQAYGRETHPLEGSMEVDLPEGESWLWGEGDRVVPTPTVVDKYVSSGAHLAGKPLISFEAMTNAVPVFRETLEDFKLGLDMSLLAGVNHPVPHGFNYSPPEAGFPGWVRFGSYLNEQNTWWPHFRRWSDYAARLSAVLRGTTAVAQAAILAPRADEWARAGLLYQPFPEVLLPWYGYHLWEALQQNGVQSDYVSENVLAKARFENGEMLYGPRRYQALFVEDVDALEPAAAGALEKYARARGTIVFIGRAPSRSPGLRGAAVHDSAVRRHIEAAIAAGGLRVGIIAAPKQADSSNRDVTRLGLSTADRQTLLAFAAEALRRFSITPGVRLSRSSIWVSHLHHRQGERDLLFFANASRTEEVSFDANVPAPGKGAWLWDPHTGERWPYPQPAAGRVAIRLGPEESLLLVFDPGPSGKGVRAKQLRTGASVPLKTSWQVLFTPVAGEPFERRLEELADLSKASADPALASFAGVAVYRAEFEAANPRYTVLDLGPVANISEVTLNGHPLGARWYGRHLYDAASALRPGRNRLEVRVTTMLGNYAKSLAPTNPVARRWAYWFPPIPAGLIGPVRLAAAAEE
jgi:hypothetical protein